MVNIAGLSILAIFLLFIIAKKNKQKSDFLLTATMLLIGGIFATTLWLEQEVNAANFIVIHTVGYYILPVYVTYGLVLIREEQLIRKNWWWYSIYAMIFTIFITLDFTVFNQYSQADLQQMHGDLPLSHRIFHKSYKLFPPIVLFWFLKRLKQYRIRIKNHYSSIEDIRLKWLRVFTQLYIAVAILSFPIFMSHDLGYVEDVNSTLNFFSGILVLGLLYLCYNGLRQYSLANFLDSNGVTESPAISRDNAEVKKYQSSTLSEDDMDKLFQRLENLFKEEQLFMEPQLKVLEVANKLNTTTHKISQTINSKTTGRFYDYVNRFRVDHLRALLSDPENQRFTILALGIDSGFNSKASMNRIFKQVTGQSPRDFQKTILPQVDHEESPLAT